ncbi:MAG: TRAP transporter large permease subunit, partial [Geminicoccaceae bacterium]
SLGILFERSILLVLMSDLMSFWVVNLFLAAIFRGLLLSAFYYFYIWARCSIQPHLAPPLADDVGPESTGELLLMVLRSFIPPVLLIVLVLGSIFLGWATPTEAAGVGAFGAILLAIYNGKLNIPTLKDVLHRSMLTNAMIFGIFVGATCFSYVFRSLGGDEIVEDLILGTGLGDWGVLLVLMLIIFALGFFFDWLEITLIVLPVFAPIVGALDFAGHIGFDGPGSETLIKTWFAILVAVNLQTSFLTPPFGFALFYLKGVAPPQVRIGDIYLGIIPFVILQLIGLALVMAVPAIALWLPTTLLE